MKPASATRETPVSGERLRSLPAWGALEAHYRTVRGVHLRQLFREDPGRGRRLALEGAGLYLDYSKNRINEDTMSLLLELAEERELPERIDAMFRGEAINSTERRPALHTALRAPASARIEVEGVDVVAEVHTVLRRMTAFADSVRDGARTGFTGKPILNVVNIGIGGSDLGPVMAYEALRHYSRRDLRFRFVSNVDPTDLAEATADLEPDRTLFIVCSKTFTTLETLTNAQAARSWLAAAGADREALARHFAAVSANAEEAAYFGVNRDDVFPMWDWVGGRYSMDSAIGLSTMIAIGAENFRELLAGFRAMDEHFRNTPLAQNLPAIMGMLCVWYGNFFDAPTVAVLPYDQYLKRFPAYLQQLTMESNGKHVDLSGHRVDYQTGAIFWGEPGTNGQHSFYQLLHQGTRLVPCDFVGFCKPLNPIGNQHELLVANLLAQTEALAFGMTEAEVKAAGVPAWLAPHRSFDGNRPSNTILAEQLTPRTLGALVAVYEHSVFTQGAIWGIDSFDQWGVELGKQAASRILTELQPGAQPPAHDSSTNALIARYLKRRGGA